MTSLLLDTNWSTQSVPFITVPLFARCSFTHRFHAFFWPHFPPPFFPQRVREGWPFRWEKKEGIWLSRQQWAPLQRRGKLNRRNDRKEKRKGTGCTEASAAHAWVQRSAFTQLLLLEEILCLLSEGQTPTLTINPLHVVVCVWPCMKKLKS